MVILVRDRLTIEPIMVNKFEHVVQSLLNT